ncbi:anillin isoform X2 [Frankliniella occidentalis]|uniref:Anillin isoform X2 n=1 Tax=Frankliniella occidentalis TaxID=133901 RepID=A0A6J1RV54_FRAOC|nr:anillin isoform X2 [Frankliniella occidentalis]
MDAFTQRMLERAQARREKLDKQLNSVGEQSASKKRAPLIENNHAANEMDLQSKCASPSPRKSNIATRKMSTASPKRTSTSGRRFSKSPKKEATSPPPPRQVSETESDEDERDSEQLSSPIHRTENNFSAEPASRPTRNKSATRSARLAALASTINEWEDDLSHPSVATASARVKASDSPKPVTRFNAAGRKRKSVDKNELQPTVSSPAKSLGSSINTTSSSRLPGLKATRKSGGGCSPKGKIPTEVTSPTKQLQWDKAMLDSLESQGFTRSTSNSRLTYDFEEGSKDSSIDSEGLQNLEEEEEDDHDESPARSPLKRDICSPSKNFNKFTSPSRSPMVMGVAQLRNYASPTKQAPGSPKQGAASPAKTQFKVNLKPVNIDVSQPEGSVLQRAAKYESEATSPSKRLARDPAELPLSERMALFEKNKGPLLVPKVPFGVPMPAKLLKETECASHQARKSPQLIRKSPPQTRKSPQKPSTSSCPPIKEPVMNLPKSPSKVATTMKQNIEESAILRRLQLFEAGRVGLEESPSRPQNQAVAERRKEMEMLSSRWNRNKEMAVDEPSSPKPKTQASPLKASFNMVPGTPPPPPPMPTLQPSTKSASPRRSPRRPPTQEGYPGLTEVKKIKVSPPKPGRLYPSLSDVEATTETEEQSSGEQSYEDAESSLEPESADNSFGKDILEAAEKVHSSYRSQKDSMDDVSITESAVLRDMDDFLDEALDSSDEERSCSPKKAPITPSKKSDSFYYKTSVQEPVPAPTLERKSPRRASTKYRAPPPPVTPSTTSEEQQLPLMHTVSFYRKQQNMTPRTPAKQVQTQGSPEKCLGSRKEDNKEHERNLVEVRVRNLLDEVSRQQTVISQASQALNLCNATVEFSGSAEQVEGERLLLLSTHKRQASLNEIQRLKVEGTLRPQNPSGHDTSNFSEHGTLHISEITLPVKRDFVRSIAAEDNSHHFVCLAKCQDVVLATSVLSISNTRDLQGGQTLRFTSSLTLPDLYSNFRVTLEIYTMTCRKEMLPHDVKYHINKKDSKHRMTPKKQKQDSHLLRPPIQSPAGPGAVRSPQFSLIGYVIFSLREIQRTSFTLNKVPYTSPLEGSVQLHLKCDLSLDIEHRGFLTMYEVVSGYGAWHRRWCLLKGEMLSYWKYPDHEKKEVPIGSIDLRSCITENVGLVTRDLCARLNTFLLETSRPAKSTDEDSLDLVCKGNVTHVRHLLSADTKEERVDWCTQLNKALTVIRAWGKN